MGSFDRNQVKASTWRSVKVKAMKKIKVPGSAGSNEAYPVI